MTGFEPETWHEVRPWAEERLAKLFVLVELTVGYFSDSRTVLDVMTRKYSYLGDKWCRNVPCTCELGRPRDAEDRESDGTQYSWLLADWQRFAYQAYALANAQYGPFFAIMRLMTVFNEFNDEAAPRNGATVSAVRSAGELADLRMWTFSVANAIGVDLPYAVRALMSDPDKCRSCLLF